MLEQIVSAVVGQVSKGIDTGNQQVDRYARWIMSLAQGAVTKWRTISASGLECSVKLQGRRGEVISCHSPAIGVCIACKSGVCLDHAMVGGDGSVICMGCVERQKDNVQRDNGSSRVVSQEDTRALREKYLHTLGLDSSASEAEIISRYRELAKKCHPDRAKTDKGKAKATRRLTEINVAYSWLTREKQKT